MSADRDLTPTEHRLVEAVRHELAARGPSTGADAALARVREGLASRRPLAADDDGPADRVPPPLVSRAVAGVARPVLRAGRDVAAVRVADATPRELLEELRRRLGRRARG